MLRFERILRICWMHRHGFVRQALSHWIFFGSPSDEASVLAWMPAAAMYFRDPDGNLLEFLAMLPEAPQPERGVVSWSRWKTA